MIKFLHEKDEGENSDRPAMDIHRLIIMLMIMIMIMIMKVIMIIL